ncbi:3-ketoacyl-CoA synthase 11-like protein [Tanacetum coccineum]
MFLMFSIASWNIQGLQQSKVRQVVSENNLSVCAILESHVDLTSLSNVCSKEYDTIKRRMCGPDLESHKSMVRDMPWVMLGDFNVALNLEDSFASSSTLNAAMCDFKDCIQNIEVLDINSSGVLHVEPEIERCWFQRMKRLKKPFRKMLHDQGNLHDRVNRLRFELDEVQKAIDMDPSNSTLRDEEAAYVQAFNEAKIDEERFLKQKSKDRLA